MRYDRVPVCKSVSNQVVVRNQKKGVDGCRLIALTGGPGANRSQCRKQRCVWFQKEAISAIRRSIRKLIDDRLNLIAYFLDAEHLLRSIRLNQPIPERRAKIHSIVKVLCLNEHVGVEQVRH